MKMTNSELISAINGISDFMKKQDETGSPVLSTGGQYAVFCNKKLLLEKYKPYEESYRQINKQHKLGSGEFEKEIKDLLSISVDVGDMRKITPDDFKDGITVGMMSHIGFMIEDS